MYALGVLLRVLVIGGAIALVVWIGAPAIGNLVTQARSLGENVTRGAQEPVAEQPSGRQTQQPPVAGGTGSETTIRIVVEQPGIPAAPPAGQPSGQPTGQQPVGQQGQVSGGAGMAPQNVEDAARVLGVDATQYLTVLYPRPGDSTAIGWVLGTSASESAGTRVSARTVPSGVCVDYDHGASSVSGQIAQSERLTANWTRALLSSQGGFTGLKATFYWTPCVFTSQSNVTTAGSGPATSQQRAGNPCLTLSNVASVIGGANWRELPGSNGDGLKYGPAATVSLRAPDHGRLDYPGGQARNGQTVRANEATYWCNG